MYVSQTRSNKSETPRVAEADIDQKFQSGDTSLFRVVTQTSYRDQKTLLRIQAAVRARAHYAYMEVGSHLGGTLCPHLLDPRCQLVISVDPRPCSQPDERGRRFDYHENSTARMIETLSACMPDESINKLRTFDSDVSALKASDLSRQVDLALIDGEHTNRAAFRDFVSVLSLAKEDVVIVFHDAQLVHDAISNAETMLRFLGREAYGCYALDNVYAIGLGGSAGLVRDALEGDRHDTAMFLDRSRSQLQQSIAFNYPITLLREARRRLTGS